MKKTTDIQMMRINTYYAVHFRRLVTSTWMDASNRFQPFFIPHICAIRAIRWGKLKRGPSSVIYLWRNHTLSSILCTFTVVIHCLKKTETVKILKNNPIFQKKNKN